MSQPQISNATVTQGIVYLNHRPSPGNEVFWNVPQGRLFIVTDLVVQNRMPGDAPVAAAKFTRFAITSPGGQDTFFIVVGNTTLSEHFTTGFPVTGSFRFYNLASSTAPFVEFVIVGHLAD